MAALADQVHTRCEARTGAGRSD